MVWPIGQPDGVLYNRAMRSREIWKEMGDEKVFWYDPGGSLHLAYAADEWKVLEEVHSIYKKNRKLELLRPMDISRKTGAVVSKGLMAGLYSKDELIVDPREAIANLPAWFQEKFNVEFYWGKCASYIADQTVYIGNAEKYKADLIFLCSGSDFETLYPEAFSKYPLTKCKLQMMRISTQPSNWRIGPALCGGLSLIHYQSFKSAASLNLLKARFEKEMKSYLHHGIHVMVSQNGKGELTIGDSHEYGLSPDPFDNDEVNRLILTYLKKFASFKNWTVKESWNGVYAKLTDGGTEIFFSPEPGVYVINALGGAGMTLSFGLCEELIDRL